MQQNTHQIKKVFVYLSFTPIIVLIILIPSAAVVVVAGESAGSQLTADFSSSKFIKESGRRGEKQASQKIT